MANISSGDENGPNKKDAWEKTKIIGQVLTPVAIAVIGIWFNVHQARRDQNAVETEVYTSRLLKK